VGEGANTIAVPLAGAGEVSFLLQGVDGEALVRRAHPHGRPALISDGSPTHGWSSAGGRSVRACSL
jgi:hypothetical protein